MTATLRHRPRGDVLRLRLAEIERLADSGATLEELDRIVGHSGLDEERRAALWLLAHATSSTPLGLRPPLYDA